MSEFHRILRNCDGVKVDHTIEAVVAFLQGDKLFNGAEIVAKVKIAVWLDAGEHPFFIVHNCLKYISWPR